MLLQPSATPEPTWSWILASGPPCSILGRKRSRYPNAQTWLLGGTPRGEVLPLKEGDR